MPTVPTCLLGFVRWTALPSLLSFLKLFIALKLTWFRASAIALDDFHFLLSRDLCFQDLITILIISFTSLLRLSPTDIRMRYHSAAGTNPVLLLGTPGVPQGPCSALSLQAAMGTESLLCPLPPAPDFWGIMSQCWGAWGLDRSSWATAYNANLPWALLCFPSCDSLCLQHKLSSAGFPQNPHPTLTLPFPICSPPHRTRRNRHRWRRTFKSLGAGVEGRCSTRDVGFQEND